MAVAKYQLIQEIERLPDDVLSALAKFLSVIRCQKPPHQQIIKNTLKSLDEAHRQARTMLAGSKEEWATDILKDREDRL